MQKRKKTPTGRTRRTKACAAKKIKKRNLISDLYKEHPEDFYSILEGLPDIVYRIDPQGNFTYINNSIRILGYEPAELIGKHFSTIVHPEDSVLLSRQALLPRYIGKTTGHQGAPKLFDERRTGRRRTRGLEIRLMPKKSSGTEKKSKKVIGSVIAFGDVTSAGYYSTPTRAKEKRFLGTLGIIRDITERRRAEEKLRYQADLLQNVSDAIVSTDLDFIVRTWNRAAEKLYGWKAFEVIDKDFYSLTKQRFSDDTKKNVMKQFLENGYWRGEITQVRNDGSQINVLTSLSIVRDSAGNAVGMVSVNRDITERKKAEVALALANARLKILQQVTTAVHSTLDIATVFKRISYGFIDTLDFNTALIFMVNEERKGYEVKSIAAKRGVLSKINAILGYPVQRMKLPIEANNDALHSVRQGKIFVRDTFTEIAHPILNRKTCAAIQRLKRSKKYIVIPLRIGSEIIGGVFLTSPRDRISEAELNVAELLTRAAANAINNAYLHIQTTEAEHALRKSEEKYRDLVENMNDVIYATDKDGIITYVSPSVEQFYGLPPSKIVGKSLAKFFETTDKKKIERRWTQSISGGITPTEYLITTSRNEKRWIRTSSRPIHENGVFAGLRGIMTDITDRRRAEDALSKSEIKYRGLVENTAVGIATTDLRGRLTYVNDTLCEMIGYTKQDVLDKPFATFLHPDDKKSVLAWFNQLLSAPAARADLEFRSIHKQGHIVYLYSSPTIFKQDQKIIGFNTIIQNITERKQAEQALRESEARWRSLTEHSPDHIMMLDTDATILYMNRPFPGQSNDTTVGTSFYAYVSPENRTVIEKTIENVQGTGNAATLEHTMKHTDGSINHFELHIGPVLHGGNVTSLIVRSADVTERKQQEERLTNSLKEKEALLREIHHRVKNNLQIIYSLLNLQAGYLDSTKYKRFFQECQDRIKSMVLIHETLYQSENLADINPVEYVNNLIKYLSHTYSIQKQRIQIQTHIDEVKMDIDTAIPCGLIINELVSNALKYAFPRNVQKREPEITITLKKDSGRRLMLAIEDNGKGLPADLDCENTRTLGLQLVCALTQQLRGTIHVQKTPGTVFTIRFPHRS